MSLKSTTAQQNQASGAAPGNWATGENIIFLGSTQEIGLGLMNFELIGADRPCFQAGSIESMITLTSSIRVDEFMIVVGHIDQLQGNVFATFQLHLETRKATESESRGSEDSKVTHVMAIL